MSSLRVALALSSFVSLGGCLSQVFSPPAGFVPLDGPARLKDGESMIALGGGVGAVGIGSELAGGHVRYRRGLEAVELQAEGAAVVVTEPSEADTFPAILSARVGVKGTLLPDFEHLAWRAGVGLGGSAGGVFGSADAGLVLGWVNPYLVPYVGVSGVASVPITSADVDITRAGDDDRVIDHPVTSFGAGVTAGLALPVGPSGALVHVGVAWLQLWDVDGEEETVGGGAIGVELPL